MSFNKIDVNEVTKPSTFGTLADSGFPALAFPTFDFAGVAQKINDDMQKAVDLMEKGKTFFNDGNLQEAADCFSQATEIMYTPQLFFLF